MKILVVIGGSIILVGAMIFGVYALRDQPKERLKRASATTEDASSVEAKYIANMLAQYDESLPVLMRATSVAKHDELKRLAQDFQAVLKDEEARLMRWQNEWGYQNATPDENRLPRYVAAGAHHRMIANLQSSSDDEFDEELLAYLRTLTSSDVQLAFAIDAKATHKELAQFAKDAVQSRYKIVNTMAEWPELWGYTPPHEG